ncbi:MAG: hypothetical protein AMK75_05975, partial [Planctomycetes bacterium SM23_65]
MTTLPPDEATPRRWADVGAAAAILVLFYLHTWLRIGPRLLLHQRNPAFVTTLAFFRSFLDRPGGLLRYVSAFLMQLCHWSWAGAVVITVVAGLVCLGTRGLLRAAAGRRVHPAASFTPAVLLLMAHGQYRHHLALSVGILGALALANLTVRLRLRSAASRLAVSVVFLVLFYYVAGGVAVLYGAVCATFEVLKRRSIAGGAVCLLVATLAPLAVAAYSYRITAVEAYGYLLLRSERELLPTPWVLGWQFVFHVILLAFFPAAVLAHFPQAARFAARLRGRFPGRLRDESGPARPAQRRAPAAWTPTSFALFLVLAVTAVWVSFNGAAKARLQVDYHATHRNWEAVLRCARRLPPRFYDPYVVHDVNLALYHTDRLGDEMFSFPQRKGTPSIPPYPLRSGAKGLQKFARFFFELGHVNLAEHMAHEALELAGQRPELLKLLTRVNILKGRKRLAQTFLNALGGHLLYRKWAEDYRRRLDADPYTAGDPELQYVRSVMVRRDHSYGAFGSYGYLELLSHHLDEHPRNRMAFEYEMAYLLLRKRAETISDNLRRLNDLGYRHIPRHWEEAVLVPQWARRDVETNLHGYALSP